MRFVSTGGQSPVADLRTALTRGLAPDGGLYLPERIDPIDASVLAELRGQPFSVVSRAVARHLLGSIIPPDDLDRIVTESHLMDPAPGLFSTSINDAARRQGK